MKPTKDGYDTERAARTCKTGKIEHRNRQWFLTESATKTG